MPDFGSWRERLAAAGGVVPRRIHATRKSSRGDGKQATSHEQQIAEIRKNFGEIQEVWWWKESRSGRDFKDRPDFLDLLDFCKSNPHPRSDPGRVEWWAPARFGRSLDEFEEPDILAFMSYCNQFEENGWQLHFVTVPRLGNSLGDVITIAVYAYAAAVYSKELGEHARRGRRDVGKQGWWVNGQAPWGTLRRDTFDGRILGKGENSSPGGGGTTLVADPEVLPHWEPSARSLLSGASYRGIGESLYQVGLRGPQGGVLGHRHIRNFLTNRHLIGEVLTRDAEGKERWVPARWEPLVSKELFEKVQSEVARREGEPRNKKRTSKGTFLMRPVCGHCGVEYHGGRLGQQQGNERTYVHPKPDQRVNPELHDAYTQAGCRSWTVTADELETGVKDLILAQRASESYEAEIRALLAEKDQFQKGASNAVASAEVRVAELETEYNNQVRLLSRAQSRGLDEDAFFDELERTQQKMNAARAELEKAEEFARSREVAWERISQVIDETRNLAETWEKVGLDERRLLLDWWVLDVIIAVEPIPGMRRANNKSAIVTLRSAPDAPKYFSVGRQLDSASESSSRTHSSSSTSSREVSTAPISEITSEGQPSLDAMRPSAQAECPRISGSWSSSAAESTGTALGEPQFPNPTATLRSSPRRLARLTGDPLNLRENSSGDSDISSTSGVPCTPSLGKNARSEVTVENLRECGQTSWQMSQP